MQYCTTNFGVVTVGPTTLNHSKETRFIPILPIPRSPSLEALKDTIFSVTSCVLFKHLRNYKTQQLPERTVHTLMNITAGRRDALVHHGRKLTLASWLPALCFGLLRSHPFSTPWCINDVQGGKKPLLTHHWDNTKFWNGNPNMT